MYASLLDQDHSVFVGCPSCASLALTDKGILPEPRPYVFGGSKVDIALEAGHLYRCLKCDLYFRYPCVSQTTLTKLYEKLPPTVWECNSARPYWALVLKLIEQYSANRDILDVGCFRGDFLSWLPNDWRKIGVEPNARARQVALERGVEMVGYAVEHTPSGLEAIGAITLLDVLEHVVDPLDVLGRLAKLLAHNGSIIIMTGAPDTLPWRIFGCDYWYCSLPEHVSFFTLNWFRWAAKHLGLSVRWFCYLSSEPSTFKQSSLNCLRLSAYALARHLRRLGIPQSMLASFPLIRKPAMWSSPPWWREAKDHILIVLSPR